MEEHKQRIGIFTAGMLILVALLFDGVQILLTVTIILPIFIGIIAMFVFWLWFKLLGVDYFKGKKAGLKLLALCAPAVTSFIPILNDIPDITAGVGSLVVLTMAEDKELLQSLTSNSIPLNVPDRRAQQKRELEEKVTVAAIQNKTENEAIPNSDKQAA